MLLNDELLWNSSIYNHLCLCYSLCDFSEQKIVFKHKSVMNSKVICYLFVRVWNYPDHQFVYGQLLMTVFRIFLMLPRMCYYFQSNYLMMAYILVSIHWYLNPYPPVYRLTDCLCSLCSLYFVINKCFIHYQVYIDIKV